jgi:glutathionylspermidine synthase
MCRGVVGDIVTSGNYPQGYALSDFAKSLIERSWKADELELYGRFDLAYKRGDIKLLEYNADTPTSLLEAAVVQWNWLEDLGLPDQFNSIHERLIAQWKRVGDSIAVMPRVYFTAMENAGREDWGTIEYLMDTAHQAGIEVSEIVLEQIGYDTWSFIDMAGKPISACFKLYPWEWMMADEFGAKIASSTTKFIEPAWKMLLSSKALLPILWEKFPNHPLLLPSHFENQANAPRAGSWARKPILENRKRRHCAGRRVLVQRCIQQSGVHTSGVARPTDLQRISPRHRRMDCRRRICRHRHPRRLERRNR